MTTFEARNLTCRHGLLTALLDVSFTLEAGQVLCVIGANGAGKTTLMRSLAGAHRPFEGQILLNGEDVTEWPAHAKLRGGIAMSPEGRRLFSDMTVQENLVIAGENGRKGAWTLETVLGAFPQLVPFLDKLAGGLSGGQRQAVAIGRALMANPEVLLLDEVSLGLSPVAIEALYQSLAQIRDSREMIMILVEQDLNRALGFADQVICMAEGAIVLEGLPCDLTKEQITKAYFGIHKEESLDA